MYKDEIMNIPMLALRGLSVFPGMMLTFDVERSASIAALNQAVRTDQMIFLASQTDPLADAPTAEEIYHVGTVCRVRQQLHQPRGGITRVLVEGVYRAQAVSIDTENKYYTALIHPLPDIEEKVSAARREALLRNCLSLFDEYIQARPEMMNKQILNLLANPDPVYVSYYVAQNVQFPVEEKQKVLEEQRPCRRLAMLGKILNNELNIISIEKEISDAAQESMNQSQREYYLREELKVIQAELGDEGSVDDVDTYRQKINALPVSDEIREKLLKELSRLAKQPFGSSEAAVMRGYLDVCLEIPWGKTTVETVDLDRARKILDDEHFGLEKVKERIIEYLAVKKLSPDIKGGLLCLVGPPGTGKTSIAMSVAKATNRKLCRISLGGVHDEAEIRGHRKTYIGSMPGRIVNGLIQSRSLNPLMVLDEIDKLSSDFRGDPASALLEALDGEQNNAFRDNYLELPIDLSQVFFITTANSLDTIPRALLDRMEVIELSSYTDEEKLEIVKRHLLPKQRKKHGLKASQLKMDDAAIRSVITGYTRESGVRRLEREIASICRKAATAVADGKAKSLNVKSDKLETLLGPVKYKPEMLRLQNEVGVVHGLAYTSVGGEMLDVEAIAVNGSGKLELTGNLGDVMKESARAAVSYIRSRCDKLGIDREFYKNLDIHVHYPEGAVPKDGPSAGITTCVALVSALSGRAVRHDVAMTGEISLRGRVLPIGGLREKTMAALRNGVKTVIIPSDNMSDLAQIDQSVRVQLNFIPVNHVDEVLENALVKESADITMPAAVSASAQKTGKTGVRQ
ncbi:MAG: endopeptidase La [Oscillospiraceae bacterium]|nr:endopeptidase La [Oscillospiraceae bacterium]